MEIEKDINTHTYTYYMSTKTITITTEAYEKLAVLKGSKESFSDVINKITGKNSLFDLIGILSKEEADELESNVTALRKKMRKDIDRRVSQLQ